MLRGRRRVGTSRLVEQFAERSGAPFLFYAATGASPTADLERFARDAQSSSLPLAHVLSAARPPTWDAAFDVLAATLPHDRPSVVVMDEVPYPMDAEGAFEGVLQRAWDRALETKPVLLVLIGSESALLVSGERSLAAEFPQQAQARTVLSAIGSGGRTFSNTARAAGGIGATPLQRALGLLTEKRVIAAELPPPHGPRRTAATGSRTPISASG